MTVQRFLDGRVTLYAGDCLDVLDMLPDRSIDSVVCDPPYHLTSTVKRFGKPGSAPAKSNGATGVYRRASSGFMGKEWDGGDVAFRPETWAEVLRVLKPGGHLAAFGGTRTYHRMACAIEDAGFEIRDQLAWTYGSGFPKSHDVSKGIDARAGAEREVVGPGRWNHVKGSNHKQSECLIRPGGRHNVTAPATEDATRWQGWGTALKPAWEPICLARRPLDGTVADNVLRHGVGGLNIDECRVGFISAEDARESKDKNRHSDFGSGPMNNSVYGKFSKDRDNYDPPGRWPANLIHDGSPEVLAGFPVTGPARSGGRSTGRNFGQEYDDGTSKDRARTGHDDLGGSAARFFYTAKADALDRLGSKHPTIKPVDLMEWLVRLITPPNGTVLDPFAGTGTTGEAAWRQGFAAVLIERDPEYLPDIARRMEFAALDKKARKEALTALKAAATAESIPEFML